jgi:hypothetical protein
VGVDAAERLPDVNADADAHPVAVLDADGVRRLAGDPLLEDAAAELAGAFAAVEAIKAVTGAGSPGALPPNLVLKTDPAEKQP